MDGQASLNDCVSIKTLHTEAQVSILGWQHSEGIASVVSGRTKHCLHKSTGKGQLQVHALGSLDSALCASFLGRLYSVSFHCNTLTTRMMALLSSEGSSSKLMNLTVVSETLKFQLVSNVMVFWGTSQMIQYFHSDF